VFNEADAHVRPGCLLRLIITSSHVLFNNNNISNFDLLPPNRVFSEFLRFSVEE